jgi:hypothetical protein
MSGAIGSMLLTLGRMQIYSRSEIPARKAANPGCWQAAPFPSLHLLRHARISKTAPRAEPVSRVQLDWPIEPQREQSRPRGPRATRTDGLSACGAAFLSLLCIYYGTDRCTPGHREKCARVLAGYWNDARRVRAIEGHPQSVPPLKAAAATWSAVPSAD